MKRVLAPLLAAAGLAALAAAPAAAQSFTPAERIGALPGQPQLTGVWRPKTHVTTLTADDGRLPPMLPAAKALYDKRVAARAAGRPIDDGTRLCLPHGTPRLMYSPYPFRLIQKPAFAAFVHEVHHMFRVAYLNQTLPPKEERDQYYNGLYTARYEGDALVIESTDFNDLTTLDRAGLPASSELKVVERYRRVGDELHATFTIEDPQNYSRPWTATQTFVRLPDDAKFEEYVCTDQNPEPDMP